MSPPSASGQRAGPWAARASVLQRPRSLFYVFGCYHSAVHVVAESSWVKGLELAVGFGIPKPRLRLCSGVGASARAWVALGVVLCSGRVVCVSWINHAMAL